MVKLLGWLAQISCVPATAFGRRMAAGGNALMNKTITGSELQYSVVNLLPGVCYHCTLRASTSKGFGSSSTRLVWTRPDGVCH